MNRSLTTDPVTRPSGRAREQDTARFRILLALLGTLVLLHSVSMMQTVDDQWVSVLFTLKNPMGAAVVLLGTLLYLDSIRLSRLMALSFIFCTYVLLNLTFRDVLFNNLFWPLMYLLWSWLLFVLAPAVFKTSKEVESYLRVAVWGSVCVAIIGWIWSLRAGYAVWDRPGGWRGLTPRYFFGFRHAGYFASMAVTVILGALLLRRMSVGRYEKRALFVVSILFGILLYFTSHRSSIILLLTTLLVDWSAWSRRRWLVALSWYGLAFLFVYAVAQTTYTDDPIAYMNYGSSGRIFLWRDALRDNLNTPLSFFVGSGNLEPLWRSGVRQVMGGRYVMIAPAIFTVFRIDNTYIEMLLLYGLLGLALFMAPIISLLRQSLRSVQESADLESRRLRTLALGIICGILVMAILTSVFPSMGNLLNVVLLVSCVAIMHLNGQ